MKSYNLKLLIQVITSYFAILTCCICAEDRTAHESLMHYLELCKQIPINRSKVIDAGSIPTREVIEYWFRLIDATMEEDLDNMIIMKDESEVLNKFSNSPEGTKFKQSVGKILEELYKLSDFLLVSFDPTNLTYRHIAYAAQAQSCNTQIRILLHGNLHTYIIMLLGHLSSMSNPIYLLETNIRIQELSKNYNHMITSLIDVVSPDKVSPWILNSEYYLAQNQLIGLDPRFSSCHSFLLSRLGATKVIIEEYSPQNIIFHPSHLKLYDMTKIGTILTSGDGPITKIVKIHQHYYYYRAAEKIWLRYGYITLVLGLLYLLLYVLPYNQAQFAASSLSKMNRLFSILEWPQYGTNYLRSKMTTNINIDNNNTALLLLAFILALPLQFAIINYLYRNYFI